MYDPRKWLYEKLTNDPDLGTKVLPGSVFSTLKETPKEKPFLVIRLDPTSRDAVEGVIQDAFIWIHDDPDNSYTGIDEILDLLRKALEIPIVDEKGVICEWSGDGPDLADDDRGTLVRVSSFRLIGRR